MTHKSIRQAAEELNFSIHALRYYERVGLISPVTRGTNGHRHYSNEDLCWLSFLTCLRNTGMSISIMKTFMDLARQGDGTLTARAELLSDHREQVCAHVAQLQAQLEQVDTKIQCYQQQAAA